MTLVEKIKEKTILIYATEYVRLDDILALLKDYLIMRMQGATYLSGEKAVEEVVEWMHGKTVVDKQKLHEFAELLKNRSINYMHHSEIDAFFELLEKKFRELKEK